MQKLGWGGVDCIDLAQDRDGWRPFVNPVMNLRGSIKCGEIFMTTWEPFSFTGTTLPVRIQQRHCRGSLRSSGMLRRVYATSSSCMDVGAQYSGYSWYLSILEPCVTVESPSSNLEASLAKSWHCTVHCVFNLCTFLVGDCSGTCANSRPGCDVLFDCFCMVQTGHGCVCARALMCVFPLSYGGGGFVRSYGTIFDLN